MMLESQYPYYAQTRSCSASSGNQKVTNIHEVSANSGTALKSAIAQGPVSVTVDAESTPFMYYTSGIVDSSAGCGTSLDHAITAVGYGSENGVEYYIIRNSWGSSWGESGYIRLAVEESGSGVCGIQQVSVWPDMA
jgi:C1A family cysteine protease